MQIIVIGGGISGLACAFHLRQLGAPVLLFEQGEQAGGVIRSVRRDGYLFEEGPQSFLATPALLELIRSLNIEDQLLRAPTGAPRYVVVGGVLRQVPLSPPALLTSSLLGIRTKLRVLGDLLGKTTPPQQDESMASFIRRKFGDELLDRLVGPFVSGIFAGDPEKLSLRSAFPNVHAWELEHGSVLRGAMKSRPRGEKVESSLCSFREGVSTLPQRLAQVLGDAVTTGVTVQRITPRKVNGKADFEVHLESRGRLEVAEASAVVLAAPADASGRILHEVSPRYAELLGQIEYAPITVVSTAFLNASLGVALKGFGFLVPRTEHLRMLGNIWNSSLFPGRAPAGQVMLTSFLGGATDPEILGYTDQAIDAAVSAEAGKLLQITGTPLAGNLRRWTRALPQYNLGHGEILAATQQELARCPGLYLAGNYIDGPSMGSCVQCGFNIADEAFRFIASKA